MKFVAVFIGGILGALETVSGYQASYTQFLVIRSNYSARGSNWIRRWQDGGKAMSVKANAKDSSTEKTAKHVHRYNIPVAWKYVFDGTVYTSLETTILRCECGKEIRRELEL